MRRVTLELLSLTGEWMDAGSVAEVEPPGSLSSKKPGQSREVFVFGWHDGAVGVWRSSGGLDVANNAIRAIVTTELARLADLESGPFSMVVWVRNRLAQVRFRLEDDELPGRGRHGRPAS